MGLRLLPSARKLPTLSVEVGEVKCIELPDESKEVLKETWEFWLKADWGCSQGRGSEYCRNEGMEKKMETTAMGYIGFRV